MSPSVRSISRSVGRSVCQNFLEAISDIQTVCDMSDIPGGKNLLQCECLLMRYIFVLFSMFVGFKSISKLMNLSNYLVYCSK